MGAKMTEVRERIRGGVRSILTSPEDGCTDLEGVKKAMREGLIAMVEGLESVMNGISDGIRNDRTARQEEARKAELRMVVMEEKVRENQEKMEGLSQARDRNARKESAQILTGRQTGSSSIWMWILAGSRIAGGRLLRRQSHT